MKTFIKTLIAAVALTSIALPAQAATTAKKAPAIKTTVKKIIKPAKFLPRNGAPAVSFTVKAKSLTAETPTVNVETSTATPTPAPTPTPTPAPTPTPTPTPTPAPVQTPTVDANALVIAKLIEMVKTLVEANTLALANQKPVNANTVTTNVNPVIAPVITVAPTTIAPVVQQTVVQQSIVAAPPVASTTVVLGNTQRPSIAVISTQSKEIHVEGIEQAEGHR